MVTPIEMLVTTQCLFVSRRWGNNSHIEVQNYKTTRNYNLHKQHSYQVQQHTTYIRVNIVTQYKMNVNPFLKFILRRWLSHRSTIKYLVVYSFSYMIRHSDGHGISNHFIAIIYGFIFEYEVIGERLYSRTFPNT